MTEIVFQTINRRKKKLLLNGPTEVNVIKQQLMDLFDPIGEGDINGKFDKLDHGLMYAGKLYDDKDMFDPSRVRPDSFVLFFRVGVEKNDESDEEENIQDGDGRNSESEGESMDITDASYSESSNNEDDLAEPLDVDGVVEFFHDGSDDDVHMDDIEEHGGRMRPIFAYSSSNDSRSDEDMSALSENDIDIGDAIINPTDGDDNESSDEDTAVEGEDDSVASTNSGMENFSLSNFDESDDESEESGSENGDQQQVDEHGENFSDEKDPTNSTMAQTIRSTIGLGFTSEQVKVCLEYSRHDTEYALNILLIGFDDLQEADWWGVAPSAECNPNKTDCLLSAENFQDLRLLLQRQPSFLKTYLKRIHKTRPEFIETIKKYEDLFINLIHIPTRLPPSVDDDMIEDMEGIPISSMVMNSFSRHANNDLHAIQNIIEVLNTPENQFSTGSSTAISEADEVIIERLMEFTRKPRDVVKMAYLRADKNEQLAANVLLGIEPF
uniref:UBA domain-containing protein n=1 Tax=Parastrongyloides trichosuri TaxID=131310 RepID=A0A0N4ZS26_PARTI